MMSTDFVGNKEKTIEDYELRIKPKTRNPE